MFVAGADGIFKVEMCSYRARMIIPSGNGVHDGDEYIKGTVA